MPGRRFARMRLLYTYRVDWCHCTVPAAELVQGGGETARMFRIQINGVDEMPWIDPIAEAGGPNRLLVRVFKDVTQAPDGKLHLAL